MEVKLRDFDIAKSSESLIEKKPQGARAAQSKERKMEDKTEEKRCTHGKNSFVNGAELCLLSKCMICKDGEWIDKKIYGPNSPVP